MINDEIFENVLVKKSAILLQSPPMSPKLKQIVYQANSLKKKRRKSIEFAENIESISINNKGKSITRKCKAKQKEEEPKTSRLIRGKMAMMSYNNKTVNENGKYGKNVCLICRQELMDDYCWQCNKMQQQAQNQQNQHQPQQQKQQTRPRLLKKQNECQLMTLRLSAKTQRTDYHREDSIKYYQNCHSFKNSHSLPYCSDEKIQQKQQQLQRSSLILHCNKNINNLKNDVVTPKVSKFNLSNSKNSSTSSSSMSSIKRITSQQQLQQELTSSHHEFSNLNNLKQKSKTHNQIIIKNIANITEIKKIKSANNKIASNLNSNNTNNTKAFFQLTQQALRTFHILTLYIQMQFLQNYNNKRQQRLNKRLNSHQRTSYNSNNNYNNNNNNIFFYLYNLIINNNCNDRTLYYFKTSNSKFTSLKNHHSNVQSQQQQHIKWKHRHHQLKLINFKMSNLSLLYKILIVLSFLSIFFPSSIHAHQPLQLSLPPLSSSASTSLASSSSSSNVLTSLKPSSSLSASKSTSQATLSRNETVCKSLDLRNTPSEFRQLENCTVIEGFLLMTLVNTHSNFEFTESYPLLTEVTEYIIVFRVQNLRSLSQIFPNLSIIRGRFLHEGYALVIYSNLHLEDLGLSKLTTIARGGVRIENNPWLCYVNTIDWSLIVMNSTDIYIEKNRAPNECPSCPDPKIIKPDADGAVESDAICKKYNGKRHCWNSKTCQKICPPQCPNNCYDSEHCCNEACVSGCSPNNTSQCTICRHYSIYSHLCIDSCPKDYFTFSDRRCVTADTCSAIGTKFENNQQETLVAFNGTCDTRCPMGYAKEGTKCIYCGKNCAKKCVGGSIDSVSQAKLMHGCTHIKNSLTISIKRGGRHLMEDLEYGLSAIQEIEGYLKVHLTYGLYSLEFFKSLRVINGSELFEQNYAMYFVENNDLEKLWNPNQTVQINNGRVFFHFNSKLCYSIIDALRANMTRNEPFNKNEVATDSNGSRGSCNPEYLNTTVVSTSARTARIKIVNPITYDDARTFIGYQYFFMVDPYKNASKHRHRPCDDTWFASEPTKENDFIISGLTPFTQYAYYIKTMKISSEPRNAQSPIQYFKTKSAKPDPVRKLEAYSNSSTEIVVQWLPPIHVYGNLSKYKIRAKMELDRELTSRNYCKEPVKGAIRTENLPVPSPPTEKPIDPDCNCYASKEKTDPYADETAEANLHEIIDFENILQNFIYVKHNESSSSASKKKKDMNKRKRRSFYDEPNDDGESFLVRHMRALPTKPAGVLSNSTIVKNLGNTTTTTMLYNKTIMDTNGKYYIVKIDEVNASTTEYVFKQLKHFTLYMLEVEACREPEAGTKEDECSIVLSTYKSTLPMENVDKVENLTAALDHSNTTRTHVRLKWDPPKSPNGAVVSYTILYTVDAKDAVEEKKCVSEQYYRNLTNGYLLTGLQGGANYSIKVRANSLAGDGIESVAISIRIPKPGIMPVWAIVLVVIFGTVCLFVGALGLYCYRQRKNLPPSDLHFYPSVNPYYAPIQYVPDNWEVARERVIQLSPLGQGSFGMVYEGILKGYNNSNEDTPCAIKTVNENATDRERINFLTEAGVMKQFETYHVVKLLGVCSRGQPALVVMELMKFGDLKSYLRKHRPEERDDVLNGNTASALDVVGSNLTRGNDIGQPPPLSRIYQMAIEIADGMAYLAAKKFVHRDLAARNCMVAADLTVKIGDFGMTRDIYETDYYRKGTKGLLPVRWMPPEALRDGIYSSASDIFSYGVVLWEMATLAAQPYQGLSNDQVLRYVIDGGVMERPENCPDMLYELMQKCWQHRPSARPTFMEIIGLLLEHADPKFKDVSFYHTEEGQKVIASEKAELQHSGDIFHDPEHDLDDATTPLRMGEYNEFQLNMDTNSSVENHGDSPMVIDDHPHSPYSLGSANIVSSTPDDQLKLDYNAPQQNAYLSSAPSTSTGVMSTSGTAGAQTAHSYPRRYPPARLISTTEETAPYVQPDENFTDEAVRTRPWRTASVSRNDATNATGPTPRSVETDERGYELYDPSTKFREQLTYDPADDEEDFDGIGLTRTGKLSGGQNLLPRQKSKQRLTTIMPISNSMPDETVNVPMSSSAASSNASSNATATASSKYPTSLKRAVAETVQTVGNTLMPKGLRNIKPRFFSHKRTGSNASHKSTSSNPASSNSHTNLTTSSTTATGKSLSGQNLGTIESGGNAGIYTTTPRFFTPTTYSSTPPKTTTTTSISDNPNYKLLDETANASAISGMSVESATTPAKSGSTKSTTSRPTTGFITGKDPQYQLLKESLNITNSPKRTDLSTLSENPNYQSMQAAPAVLPTNTSSNPNYIMMNEPAAAPPAAAAAPPAALAQTAAPKFSVNPNYQIMGPQLPPAAATATAPQPFQTSTPQKFFPAYGYTLTSDEEDPDNADDDDTHTEHIKMERMPLSRQKQQSDIKQKKRGNSRSRSRSKSRTKSVERSNPATTTIKTTTTPKTITTQSGKPSSFSLKEKWLRQQQQQPPQPPPNGFIGREG